MIHRLKKKVEFFKPKCTIKIRKGRKKNLTSKTKIYILFSSDKGSHEIRKCTRLMEMQESRKLRQREGRRKKNSKTLIQAGNMNPIKPQDYSCF